MKVFRYNSHNREDRKFNRCGREKNPMAVRFYATNLDYAERYRYIYNDDGELIYECELEVADIDTTNLFDMNAEFQSLNTYRKFIENWISVMRSDYNGYLNAAKTKSERKLWTKKIDELKDEEAHLIGQLNQQDFQQLSDFELQIDLVAELKSMGFTGYITKNEIAIF
jgi:hypothetical protein